MKVMRKPDKTTASTNVKTPCSMVPKKTRKKLHWGTKANHHCQNCQRVQMMNMNRTTEPVPRTSKATATDEVTGIKAP